MKVYSTAEAPVIIFSGSGDDASELRSLLKRFPLRSGDQVQSLGSGAVPGPSGAPEAAPLARDGLLPSLDTVSPGLWLFAGGALVLTTLLLIRYVELKRKGD